MSFRKRGAQRASTSPRSTTSRSLGALARVGVAFAIASGVPFALPPTNAAASQCGTNWESKTQPPDKIRVYRESRDRVDVVDFQRYVEVVMTVEWPHYVPRAVLRAGAIAAKQFAWYHALDGHHRSSYVTRDGECYDVKDTHMDQIYKPEGADIHDRLIEAVEETWGHSLRQDGRFFLTQYRSGENVSCGRDRNGRILYARSAIDCADDGKDFDRILDIYYGPDMTIVEWDQSNGAGAGDGTAPEVVKPTVKLRAGDSLEGKVATVSWSATDASGIARYRLQRRVDRGPWREVELADATSTETDVVLDDAHRYAFRVRAQDGSGLWSDYTAAATPRVTFFEGGDATLRGGWKLDQAPSASGGHTRFTRNDAASATFRFTGHGVAYIAPRGQDRGSVDIFIDGDKVDTIDLAAANLRPQRVVFARNWVRSGEHTIRVVARGDHRVDVDAFIVLK